MNCDMCDTLKEDVSAYKVEGHTFNWCAECVEANGYLGERVSECLECEGDGCTLCTVFCGDCLTPIENCGCEL